MEGESGPHEAVLRPTCKPVLTPHWPEDQKWSHFGYRVCQPEPTLLSQKQTNPTLLLLLFKAGFLSVVLAVLDLPENLTLPLPSHPCLALTLPSIPAKPFIHKGYLEQPLAILYMGLVDLLSMVKWVHI